MTLYETQTQKIPDYYPTMYMDGFTPSEILAAARSTMKKNYLGDPDDNTPDFSHVKLVSEVTIKK